MKEITRIHLARIAYDIELEAKKALEVYVAAVAKALHDDDTLHEVELRMIELLSGRGVASDGSGVITGGDVDYIKHQLGDPKEFSDETSSETEAEQRLEQDTPKRLLRDEERAMFGGVLAGLAAYLQVDVAWLRLLAVLGLFFSFGTVALVYVVMWLVIPPARTASERLQMSGREATLSALRDMGATAREMTAKHRPWIVALRVVVTVGLLLLTALLLVVTAIRGGNSAEYIMSHHEVMVIDAIQYTSMLLGLLLLAVLFVLLARAVWVWSLTRRLLTTLIAVVVAGMICVAVVVVIAVVRQQGSFSLHPDRYTPPQSYRDRGNLWYQ